MKHPNGSEGILSTHAFAQLVAIAGCICPDGKPRRASVTGQPCTAWSVPGSVQVSHKGRVHTVSGVCCFNDCPLDGKLDGWEFIADEKSKNGKLFEQMKAPSVQLAPEILQGGRCG